MTDQHLQEPDCAVTLDAVRVWLASPQTESDRLRGIARALKDPAYAAATARFVNEPWVQKGRAWPTSC